jgi:hypothetical protein
MVAKCPKTNGFTVFTAGAGVPLAARPIKTKATSILLPPSSYDWPPARITVRDRSLIGALSIAHFLIMRDSQRNSGFAMSNRDQPSVPLPPELRTFVAREAVRGERSQAAIIGR